MAGAPAWAPPAYEPSLAVRALAFLGSEACNGNLGRCLPPTPDVPPTDRQWYMFAMRASVAPSVLLAVGVATSFVSILLICRVLSAPPDRAGSRRQLVATSILFFLACLAAGLSLQSALWGFQHGAESFRRASTGFRHAEDVLVYAGNASAKMGREVLMISEACPHVKELFKRANSSEGWDEVRKFQASAEKDLQAFGKLVAEARKDIKAIPHVLDRVGSRVAGWPEFLLFSFMTPAKVFGLGGLIVLVLALRRCTCGGKSLGDHIEGLFAGLGFIVLAVLMIVAACGAAVALGLTVASGSFCQNPGVALPDLAQRSLKGVVDAGALRAAGSYVAADFAAGHRSTPGAEALESARQRVQSLASTMKSHQRQLDMLELICDDVYRMELNTSVERLQRRTSEAIQLLSGGTVYEHYRQVVDKSICGTSLEATAMLAFFQALVGLVCLPLLAVPTLSFLRGEPVPRQFGQQMSSLNSPQNYERLQGSQAVFRSVSSPGPVIGPGPPVPGASPPLVARFDSALSSISEGFRSGNGILNTQSYKPVFGSQVVHSSPGMIPGSQVMHSAPGALQGHAQDSLMSFLPSKKGTPVMTPSRGERRVHFADELGRSLFGSQTSAMSSMRSSTPMSWGASAV